MEKVRVTQLASARIPTPAGQSRLYLYSSSSDNKEHVALVIGEVTDKPDVLVRVHSECFTGDVMGSLRCDCGAQLSRAMNLISSEGSGVIIYLRQEGRGIGLLQKLHAYNLQDQGYDTVEANLMLGHGADERDYTIAALILENLGINSIRLLTNNPLKTEGLQKSGITVSDRVPLLSDVTSENAAYLLTKAQRMKHILADTVFAFNSKQNGSKPQARVNSESSNGNESYNFSALNISSESHIDNDGGIDELLRKSAAHSQRADRPFITLSYAQSLDGCIAISSNNPLSLSNPHSLVLTHKLRATHDAILIGIGAALADNPRLTVRLVEGNDPQPIVVDSQLRLPLDTNLLRHRSTGPWIATTENSDTGRQKKLEEAGARVLRLPATADGLVDLSALLERLRQLGINRLMVEGGASIITSFLSQQLVDHVVLTIAPMVIGGLHAVNGSEKPDRKSFPRLNNLRHQRLGDDMVIWGDPNWE
jgi:3,4-dihydroxy 2-butanone 4-phosphate synthase/GTP cyclohydrolase II